MRWDWSCWVDSFLWIRKLFCRIKCVFSLFFISPKLMWLLPWKMYFISVSLFWRSSSRTPRVCSETGRTKQKHHFLHHVVHYDQLSKLGKVEHYSFAYISLEYLFMFFWPSSPLLLLTSEFCQLMLYHFCCLRTLGVSELIFFFWVKFFPWGVGTSFIGSVEACFVLCWCCAFSVPFLLLCCVYYCCCKVSLLSLCSQLLLPS